MWQHRYMQCIRKQEDHYVKNFKPVQINLYKELLKDLMLMVKFYTMNKQEHTIHQEDKELEYQKMT